jgi:hypothetical protein
VSTWRELRSAVRGRRSLALLAALAASAVLLAAPSSGPTRVAAPLTAGQAWPHAHHATAPADLPHRMTYQPILYLDAATRVTLSEAEAWAAHKRSRGSVRLCSARAPGILQE